MQNIHRFEKRHFLEMIFSRPDLLTRPVGNTNCKENLVLWVEIPPSFAATGKLTVEAQISITTESRMDAVCSRQRLQIAIYICSFQNYALGSEWISQRK